MEMIIGKLMDVVYFFMNNWIAAAVLAVVVLIAIIKKPKEFFKVTAVLVLMLGVLYVLMYLEKSTFSGVDSKKHAEEIDRQAGQH